LRLRREGFHRTARVCEGESALQQNHLVYGQDNTIGACPPFDLSLPTPIHSPINCKVLARSPLPFYLLMMSIFVVIAGVTIVVVTVTTLVVIAVTAATSAARVGPANG
jgi:hypothetical protein